MDASKHIELIEQHFDKLSLRWRDLYYNAEDHRNLVLINRKNHAFKFIQDHCPIPARVLDAGCGAGLLAIDLAQAGYDVTGIDISKEMISLGQEALSAMELDPTTLRFEVGEVESIKCDDASYDAIVALGYLQYQVDEGRSLDFFHRILRPGGVLVASGPQGKTIANKFGRAKPKHAPTVLDQISVHFYNLEQTRELLREHGFELLDYKRHGFINFQYSRPIMFVIRRLVGEMRVHKFLTAISRIIPIDVWANDLDVVARRVDK